MSDKYPNWFLMTGVDHFYKYLKEYKDQPNLKFLQIGTYTGDASKWLLDNVLTNQTSILIDVDTWQGSDESVHKQFNWNDVEQTYDKKVSKYNNIIKHKKLSKDFLTNNTDHLYDFIYIDGDHTANGVYSDAELSWNVLKNGGILAFDDYTWQHESGLLENCPGPGIDRFLNEKNNMFELLERSNQLWIKKI